MPEMHQLEEHIADIKGDMDKYKGQGGQNDRLVVFFLFPPLFLVSIVISDLLSLVHPAVVVAVSVSVSLSLSLCCCLCLSVFLFLFLSLSLSFARARSLSLSLSLSLALSLSISLLRGLEGMRVCHSVLASTVEPNTR